MKKLISEICRIKKTNISKVVDTRLKEFSSFKDKDTKHWFSELCFCLLTANSKARTAINIQNELGADGFHTCSLPVIRDTIRNNKHRFHNNKAKYIVAARPYYDIKKTVQEIVKTKGELAARAFLAETIKGLGYKEASHFMRNVGYKNLAILDRHIVNLMVENGIIKEKPKTLNKKVYISLEQKFFEIAKAINMSPAELDLYMWYMKAGEVLK